MINKIQIKNSLRDDISTTDLSIDEDVSPILRKLEALLRMCEIKYMSISCRICPTILYFEIISKEVVPKSNIKAMQEYMALLFSPLDVRIVSPDSEKGIIGIEVPRRFNQIIGLKRILKSAEFNDSSLTLPIALGIDTDYKPVVGDLAEMRHLLIGGTTGQGKTTFLNALIVSLLCSKSPDELKFILIDLKRVEFGIYETIKNKYIANLDGIEQNVIKNKYDAVRAINTLVDVMDSRYELLHSTGCRSISEYNNQTDIEKIPYLVVIIDEFAVLMMEHEKDFEIPLVKLAQMSCWVGIHLIIATVRPSNNVISDVMKTNFPNRVAFKVSSESDSNVILDCNGASKLVGPGDTLLSLNGSIKRVQTPLIDSDEIEKVCKAVLK